MELIHLFFLNKQKVKRANLSVNSDWTQWLHSSEILLEEEETHNKWDFALSWLHVFNVFIILIIIIIIITHQVTLFNYLT